MANFTNTNLHNAKTAKNDEFYTLLSDIEAELSHYPNSFRGKVVLCNCDNPDYSNFWKYFHFRFTELGLKRLIAIHYNVIEPAYVKEYSGGNDKDISQGVVKLLYEDGDFQSEECIEILKQADIVVTNPPFSLMAAYIQQLVKYNKQYIIVANKNIVSHTTIFPLLKEGKMWLGANTQHIKYFLDESGNLTDRISGLTRWFTNMKHNHKVKPLITKASYSAAPEKYPYYDNFPAININSIRDIPMDFDGLMGVPITFMDYYCPEQYELLNVLNRYILLGYGDLNEMIGLTHSHATNVDGKTYYKRILIKRR